MGWQSLKEERRAGKERISNGQGGARKGMERKGVGPGGVGQKGKGREGKGREGKGFGFDKASVGNLRRGSLLNAR